MAKERTGSELLKLLVMHRGKLSKKALLYLNDEVNRQLLDELRDPNDDDR